MIRWSDPLYPSDWHVAKVGAVEIGYIIPPCRTVRHWRWYITFRRGRDVEGRAAGEHHAKASVAAHWRQWTEDAQLLWFSRGEVEP